MEFYNYSTNKHNYDGVSSCICTSLRHNHDLP